MANRYVDKPSGNFGQLAQLQILEAQKANQPTFGDKALMVAASALNAGISFKANRDALQMQRQEKQMERDQKMVLAGYAPHNGQEQSEDVVEVGGKKWIRPKEKSPDKQTKVEDWVSEDLSDPNAPKYFLNRVTADAKGDMVTKRVAVDKDAYGAMKRKETQGSRDFYGTTPQERSIEKDMADLKSAKYSAEPNKEGVLTWVYNKEWPKIYEEAKLRYANRPDLLARIETYNRSGISPMQAQQVIPGWHTDANGQLVRD